MRSWIPAKPVSVTGVKVEAAIDGGAVALEKALALLGVAAPAGQVARRQQLLEGRARPGGAEDDPRPLSRRAPDLPPQPAKAGRVHPVEALEQDVAIAACRRLVGKPVRHRLRMGLDPREAVADRRIVHL